ncbi:zinc finger protein [Forsythia ovata]|uniref:Zinc finger protein n=1 Tax=Forsythia ovata TaxID=205694 RepID=A0ABD1T8V0_9LAMI
MRMEHVCATTTLDLNACANFVGTRRNSGRRGTSGRGYSGQYPSFANSGGQSNSGRGRGRGGKSNLVCQICEKTGHGALMCYKRFDVYFRGGLDCRNSSSKFDNGRKGQSFLQAYVAFPAAVKDDA